MQVNVPLVLTGEDLCPGLRKGGTLNFIRRWLPTLCKGDSVPENLTVDIAALEIGGTVAMGALSLPANVTLRANDLSLPVVKIMGRSARTAKADAEASLTSRAPLRRAWPCTLAGTRMLHTEAFSCQLQWIACLAFLPFLASWPVVSRRCLRTPWKLRAAPFGTRPEAR